MAGTGGARVSSVHTLVCGGQPQVHVAGASCRRKYSGESQDRKQGPGPIMGSLEACGVWAVGTLSVAAVSRKHEHCREAGDGHQATCMNAQLEG